MKLTILCDNNTIIDKYFLGEPGLSFYIEADGEKILFDTGYSDVFIKNAQKAGIDLNSIGCIVLSHGHNDHTGGLKYLKEIITTRPKLIACPEAFKQRYDCDGEYGCPVSKEVIEKFFEPFYCEEPYFITKDIVFLGKIKRTTDFEAQMHSGYFKKSKKPDFVPDDSAIAVKTQNGLVIVTGCSHSGIVNICEYAKEICKTDKICAIIGGMHLKQADKLQLEETVDYIKNLNLKTLHACHCTGFRAQCMLSSVSALNESGSGLVIEL